METLTPALLNELIEKIEVYSIEGKGKNRTQRIIIHYRFFGVIENPVEFLFDVISATFSPATAEAVAYNICNAMELFLSGFT